jgi:hypothetical protein
MEHLRALASGRDCDDSEEWLRGQIQRINAERKALVGTPEGAIVTVTGSWRTWSGRWRTAFR